MTTIGDAEGRRRGPQSRAGVGVQVGKLADSVYVEFKDFSGGYSVEKIPEATQQNRAQHALDMNVDYRGRLVRMDGVAVLENLVYKPDSILVHPNLDNEADVVLIAGPYVGFRRNAQTAWINAGVPAGAGWSGTIHANSLVFSNGVGDVFVRPLGTNAIIPLGWGEARALQSFAGRIFAGAANIGGTNNPLGIKWTGASGEYDDLSGYGAGSTLR